MRIKVILIGLIVIIFMTGLIKFGLLFLEYRLDKQKQKNQSLSNETNSNFRTDDTTMRQDSADTTADTDENSAGAYSILERLSKCERENIELKKERDRYMEKAIVTKIVQVNITKNITEIQEHELMNLRPEYPTTAAYSAGFDECKRRVLDILGLKKTKFAERESAMKTEKWIGENFFREHVCFRVVNGNFTDYIDIGLDRFFILMRNDTYIRLGVVEA